MTIVPRGSGKKRAALLVSGILALTILVFANTFQNEFLNWDDAQNVYNNVSVRNINVESLKVYFTRPLLAMYTPLVYLSYALDYRIGHLNPFVYHATNLLLHLLNVTLVFHLVRLMTQQTGAAAFAALVFAVHPMNAAAVTPVSVRSSLLYTLFYLAAYICYISYIRRLKDTRSDRWRLAGAGVFFLLSLLSKSAAVVFPLLMALTDWYYGRKLDRRSLAEKLPFFALSLVFGILTFVVREHEGHIGSKLVFSLLDRIFLVSYSIVFYLIKLFAPFNLAPYYLYPAKTGGLLPVEYYCALPALLVIGWVITRAREYRKPVVFGIMFYFVHIVLVLKIIPMGSEMVCDRYAYLPYVGLLFAMVTLAWQYAAGSGVSPWKRHGRTAALIAAAGYVALFSWISYERNPVWKNDIVFYDEILKTFPEGSPGSAFAYFNRGNGWKNRGDFMSALSDYNKAISIDPFAAAYSNRGNIKRDTGDREGALSDYNKAISVDPLFAAAYSNRGNMSAERGDFLDALSDYDKAISIDPSYVLAYSNRASVKEKRGDFPGALSDYDKVISIDPLFALAYCDRGTLRVKRGEFKGALSDYNKAISLDPLFAAAYNNRGNIKRDTGDREGALKDYDKAISADPSFGLAYSNRANIKTAMGDNTGACADWKRAAGLGNREAQERVAQQCM